MFGGRPKPNNPITDSELENPRQLFADFITESRKLLPKDEKHQFVLLPAAFITFAVNNDLTDTPLSEPKDTTAKQKWDTDIEVLKEQALVEFHKTFDSDVLKKLQSVAHYLVIGIDTKRLFGELALRSSLEIAILFVIFPPTVPYV